MFMRYSWVLDTQDKILKYLGFYYLYLLPAFNQLPGRGARPNHYDARPATSPPFVAYESLPPYCRHLRPTYILGNKAWNTAIRLVETDTGTGIDRYESHWNI
jgi:hypothetical protein